MSSSIEKVTISDSHETGSKMKPPLGEPEGYMSKWYRFCMFGGMALKTGVYRVSRAITLPQVHGVIRNIVSGHFGLVRIFWHQCEVSA